MAFVGLPVAFLLTASGLGLLVEKVVRTDLPNALLAPVGFCGAVSLLLAVFKAGGHVEHAVVALVVPSLAGYVLARHELRRVIDLGAAGLAGLAIYLLYSLPMLATGGWTWLGYNFVNDTAVQFLLIDHLKESGTDVAALPNTTGGQSMGTFFASGYPLGTHSYGATLSGILGQPMEVVYQSFLAMMAAMAALSIAVIGRSVAGARVAAGLATVAMASNLTLQYAFQGNIKEIGVLAAICASAAVGAQIVRSKASIGLAGVLGVCIAGILSTYNAAGGPYAGAIGVSLVAAVLAVHGRAALQRRWFIVAGVVVGAAAVCATAALTTIRTFYNVASTVVGTSNPTGEEFGALQHRLPLSQSSGIWLDGRYFEPIEPDTLRDTLTTVGAVVVIALLVLALAEVYRRRRPEALLLLVPVALTAAAVAPGVSPYADGKLLAILSPAVIFTAGIGLLLIWQRARPMALAVGAGLLVLIGLSDSFAYRDVKPAPQDRMEAMKDAAANVPGKGPVLSDEFDEFAKYFDPQDRINVSSESITPRPAQLVRGPRAYARFYDLDEQKLSYVASFDHIITRRSPAASRPPGVFRRVYENAYYTVWGRDPRRPGVLRHLPLRDGVSTAVDRPSCATVRELARDARRAGGPAHLRAWNPAATVLFDVARARGRSPAWPLNGEVPETVTVGGPGQARGTIDVLERGEYFTWLRADVIRKIDVEIDGRTIGDVGEVNTPGQWLPVGSVRLTAGRHRIRVSAGGRSLRPGTGALGLIGSVSLVREQPGRMERVALSDARSLCGRELDWIEVVRGA